MEFRGNAGLFVRQVLIVTLILGPLFAIFAVGAAWIRIFLLSLLVFAPFLALLYFAIKRWDRLSFDDQRGAAVLPLRGSIPYQKIPAFEVVTAGPSFHVDAKFGRFLRLRFLASGDRSQQDAFLQHLRKRFPNVPVRERAFPIRLLLVGSVAALLILHFCFAFYLQTLSPHVMTPCVEAEWLLGERDSAYGETYEFRGVPFSLPQSYRLVEADPENEQFLFENDAQNIRVRIGPHALSNTLSDFQGRQNGDWSTTVFAFVMGSSGYELARSAYCAQIGIIPLILKTFLTAASADGVEQSVQFYELQGRLWKGLAKIDSSGSETTAEVLLAGVHTPVELSLSVEASGPLDEAELARILEGIQRPA